MAPDAHDEHPGSIDRPGVRLAFRVTGAGPPVVLVHAGIADMRMWDPLVALLHGRARVARFDMRGFGLSRARDASPYSHRDDLTAVLDEVGFDAPLVVGASFGGLIALEHAAARPERTGGLVLLASALDDHEPSPALREYDAEEERLLEEAGDVDGAVELNLRQWVDGPTRDPGDVDPAVRAAVAEMCRTVIEQQLELYVDGAALEPPPSARLAGIDVPATVAYGTLDVPDFEAIARRLAAGLPRARLVEIAGAGHLLALERPREVADLVLGAL